MQTVCQWLLVGMTVFSFYASMDTMLTKHSKDNAAQQRCFLVSYLLFEAIMIALLIGAGAFDHLNFWSQQ
jgi:hypothetical protein